MFCESNIVGEDAATGITDLLKSSMNSALDYIRFEYEVKPEQKLLDILKADNLYKDGVNIELDSQIKYTETFIKERELELACFNTSEKVLTNKLTSMKYELLSAESQLRIDEVNIRTAKAQALLAEFESSEEYLDLKLNQIRYEATKWKYEAAISEMNASDEVLGYIKGGIKADSVVRQFEASDEVMSLKKAILESENQKGINENKSIKAQILLALKQRDGFHLDSKIKLLGILFDGWSKAYMNGLEAIPSVVNNDYITDLFKTTAEVSDGFNGGKYLQDIKLTAQESVASGLTLGFSWDSGIPNGDSDTTLTVQPNWQEVVGYPMTVNSSGSHSLTIGYPAGKVVTEETEDEDGNITTETTHLNPDVSGYSVLITATTVYYSNPMETTVNTNADGACCDEDDCNVKFIRSSQFVYSIKSTQT
jgi:hypothetical protein